MILVRTRLFILLASLLVIIQALILPSAGPNAPPDSPPVAQILPPRPHNRNGWSPLPPALYSNGVLYPQQPNGSPPNGNGGFGPPGGNGPPAGTNGMQGPGLPGSPSDGSGGHQRPANINSMGDSHSTNPKHRAYLSPHFPLNVFGDLDGSAMNMTDVSRLHHHRHHRIKKANESQLLSTYLVEKILEPYANFCYAHLLSSGNLDLSFNYAVKDPLYVTNITLNSPTLLIRCNDSFINQTSNTTYKQLSENSSSPASSFLRSIALSLDAQLAVAESNIKKEKQHEKHKKRKHHRPLRNESAIYDNTKHFLSKVSFDHSLIMVMFLCTTVCVGAWMIFVIILLLPSDNHIKTIPVLFYVTFYAIVQTIYLNKTVTEVFVPQYNLNIQDTVYYEMRILNTNAYKTCELIVQILGNINWIYIVYYMYHKEYKRGKQTLRNNQNAKYRTRFGTTHTTMEDSHCWFLPSFLNNRNRIIVTVGTILLLMNSVPFGILLWVRNLSGVRGLFKAFECLIYTVFLLLILGYIWLNFGNVLVRQRVRRKVKLTLRNKIKVIWKDYYQIVPLLVYNFVAFVLSYFCNIYFTTRNIHFSRWRFNFIYLLKILITVNTWGLIGVFEKREIALNKKTILGRKIDSTDPFFFDPSSMSQYTGSISPRSSGESYQSVQSSQLSKGKGSFNGLNLNKIMKPAKLSYPLSSWCSKINRARDGRQWAKERLHRIANKISGSNSDLPSDTHIHTRNSSCATKNGLRSFSTSFEDGSDSESVETELTRNVIYYHDQGSSISYLSTQGTSGAHTHRE